MKNYKMNEDDRKLIEQHKTCVIQIVAQTNNVKVFEVILIEGFEKFLIKPKNKGAYLYNIKEGRI